MHPTVFAVLLSVSPVALSMCAAGLAVLGIGLLAAKNDVAQARGVDSISSALR